MRVRSRRALITPPSQSRDGTAIAIAIQSRRAAYAATRGSGFYDKNRGREIPLIEMTAKPPTENSRGLRLGNLVQIRDIIAEDLEAAFAGKQDAQSALDDAVKRGNGLLRQFERNTQQ